MTAVPVRIQVTRFACPFCSRSRAKQGATAEHILRCWKNPANRTCKTCVHYQAPQTGSPCVPGRHCTCNDWDEACTADDGPEPDEFPVVACPLWEGRPGYPAMEPTVVPCRECATPLGKPQRGSTWGGQWLCDECAAPIPADGPSF
jgi:hypothetical protein